jgi:hypothetical protein
MTMTVMAWVTTRSLPPAMIIFGSMHALVSLCLGGEKMAAIFDAKPQWRARFKLDEQGVIRVRKSVTRAASSLPALIMFALAPREGQELLALTAFTLALVGVGGILAGRTLGVLAFVGGAAATVALVVVGHTPDAVLAVYQYAPFGADGGAALTPMLGVLAAVLLGAAALPFAKPMAAYVLRRR